MTPGGVWQHEPMPASPPDQEGATVVVLLKTVEGGRWAVPSAAALARRGHRVVFALPAAEGGLPDLVRAAGMAVEAVPVGRRALRPWGQLRDLRALRTRLVDDLGADVVVSHLFASAMAGRLALVGSGIPHVYVSHGPLYLENPLIRQVERVLARLDHHHLGSSGAMVNAYRHLGVRPDRLSLVPNAIAAGWSEVDHGDLRRRTRAELGIAPDAFVATCVAYFYAPKRLVHRGRGIKGHDVLLEAWQRHRDAGGSGELLLVGSGFGAGGEAYREEVLGRFGAVPGVHWIGGVPDVRPYLCAADVNISPSLSENLGSASEAGVLGLPTIASAVGGLPEVVVDGWSGWLVRPDDAAALAAAIADAASVGAAELARRGAKARQRAVELHDEAAVTGRWADVVEQVVRDAAGAR
jgi:glycosyltransferase involved in cell wall biosynthesis